ncbi:conserved hypothetical protein [Culex quinquefasciatus]|uniref:Uncharacterized protein n=1 Tax=Culex quinquefasciatus TaxID=7176 RepID=B0WCY2_CULQU|nr:conserved hypothetical protein [Culex quinquefasciatus]|eukprot:XP_001846566.1 conserved hypothetical protein [Culex quinquefasciatus]
MGKRNRLLPIGAICWLVATATFARAFNFDDDLEDLIAEESTLDEEVYGGGSVLPSAVFNGGKPFLADRDPSTGVIDFSHKKTINQIDLDAKTPYETKDSHVSDTKDVILTQSSPNFHDFLNLPVKYTPSKFVYPLISSSYANLKYQGSNKVSNHKNLTAAIATTTVPPKFQFSRPAYTNARLNTTRQQPTTTTSVSSASTRYTYPTTSGRPITTTTTTTTTTTEVPPTTLPPKQLFTRYPYKSTIKNKYLETTKKNFFPSTLSMPTTTTQKPTATEQQTTPIRSSTYYSPSVRPWTNPSTYTTTTTNQPTIPPRPAHPIRFVEDGDYEDEEEDTTPKINFTIPALKYEGNRPAPFRPLPSTHVQLLNRKNESSNKIELPKNPNVMSLSDIFNSIGLDDQQREDQLQQQQQQEQENTIIFETTLAAATDRTTPPAIVLIQDNPQNSNDQYVKYEVHQPNGHRPQQPQVEEQQQTTQQYPQQEVRYEVYQPNGHRPQAPSQEADLGQHYVKYDVQQPQINIVKYGQVPSMNSVVISPNQHSATFVLGSQQSVGSSADAGHFVGSVSQGSASASALNGHPSGYQMGQVLDEPNEPTNVQVGTSVNVQVQVKPQDIIKTTSVRFPSESDDKYENAQIISGSHKSEVLPPNGHSAPIGLGPNQMVVFPSNDKIDNTLHEVSNRIVFDGSNNDALNKNELAAGFPSELPDGLTPPPPENAQLSKRPRPPMPAQGPPPFMYKEIQRRPFPGDRIRPALQLPNILPQFRPNAKISHGHNPYHKEAGNYRVPPPAKSLLPSGPPIRKVFTEHPSSSPTLANRRQPPTANRFMSRINTGRPQAPTSSMEGPPENRRYYRLPPPMLKDRVFHINPPNLKPPPVSSSASRFAESYAPPTPEKTVPPPPPRRPEEPETNEFQRDPPTILKGSLSEDNINNNKPVRPKLEPVVTLQMLQSKKQTESQKIHNLPSGQKVDLALEGHPPVSNPAVQQPQPSFSNDGKQPVYVVYPVKSTPMKMDPAQSASSIDPIVVGLRGDQSPLPPSKISPGTEYQNTPFSIASHFEQEPILMAKDKKHHQKVHFPYSLERPDPHAIAEIDAKRQRHDQATIEKKQDTIYNIGEEPVSKEQQQPVVEDSPLISSKLHRVAESTPIAIAYTPTESTYKYKLQNSPYYSPYGETQTEVSYLKVNDYDEFGNLAHRYEQSFQAPFQASISLDPVKVTNPYEGWAVVTGTPPQALIQEQPQAQQQQQNKIDRSDDHHFEDSEPAASQKQETTNTGGFQPEFQGGFRPIYAEDVKLSELANPDPQSRNAFLVGTQSEEETKSEDSPAPTIAAEPAKKQESASAPSSVEKFTDEQEEKPLFGDLEAFFDNLTKDYDDNTEPSGLDDDEEDFDESTSRDENGIEGRSATSGAEVVTEKVEATNAAKAEEDSSAQSEKKGQE